MKIPSRTRTTVAASFMLLFLSFIAINCIESPLEPIAPSSDIQLSIPMVETTHTAGEFIQNSPSLILNSDGTYSYIMTQNGDPVPITTISSDTKPSQQQVQLGQFNVDPVGPINPKGLTLSDLGLTSGTIPFFPEATVPVVPTPLDLGSQFGFMAIDNGSLSLTITNNLPLPIDFISDIVLRNNSTSPADNAEVARFHFPNAIPVGQSTTITADLSQKLMRSELKTDSIQMRIQGTTSPVTFQSSDSIAFRFQSTTLRVDSAQAVIPEQDVFSKDSTEFIVADTLAIHYAEFSQGSLQIAFINQLNIQVDMFVKLKEFINKNTGNSFTINQRLNGKDSLIIPISMVDWRIETSQSDPIGTKLTYSVGINTITSGINQKIVTKNDLVRAEIRPGQKLVVKSVTGKIAPMDLPVDVKMKSNFENVAELQDKLSAEFIFKGIKINMHLPITGGFPTDYDLRFIAKNSKKNLIDSITLPVTDEGIRRIYPNRDPNLDKTTITITNAPNFDTFLGKFFPDLPDSFFVRGNVIINPKAVFETNKDYTIDDESKVYPSYDINFPSFVGIKNGRMKDVIDLKGAGKVPEEFSKNVKSAQVNFVFGNRIPFDMGFKLRFVGNNNNHRDTVLYIDPSDIIKAAKISPADSTASDTTISRVAVTMDPNVVDIRSGLNQVAGFNAADSLVLILNFETSNNGSAVKLRSNDYIKIRASINSTYTVNKQ